MADKLVIPPDAKRIVTDWVYKRRPIQKEIHTVLNQFRFAVLVAHRRFGKTVVSVNQLILKATKDMLVDGRYAYVAPFRNQAKLIAWEYLKRYTSVILNRKINEQELSVTLPGNISIRIFGADNPDALRGTYFDGIVLDEVAQMRREVWLDIVRPALADRKGWAVFIGTVKGQDLFHELYLRAQSDTSGEWTSMMFRVSDTDVLPTEEVEQMRADMGEGTFRREMLCDFSASSDDKLIPLDDALNAAKVEYMPTEYLSMPSVFGVDVGRFGDDRSVVFERRGLVAKAPWILAKADNVEVAERITSLYHEQRPQRIFVDAGQGQGVIDILHRVIPGVVIEVPFGSRARDGAKFANRRAEMWYLMREWLKAKGSIPDMPDLVTELTAPIYKFNAAGKIILEPKEDIKDRLGKSPDLADALALTFAEPMMPTMGAAQTFAITNSDLFENYNLDRRQKFAHRGV